MQSCFLNLSLLQWSTCATRSPNQSARAASRAPVSSFGLASSSPWQRHAAHARERQCERGTAWGTARCAPAPPHAQLARPCAAFAARQHAGEVEAPIGARGAPQGQRLGRVGIYHGCCCCCGQQGGEPASRLSLADAQLPRSVSGELPNISVITSTFRNIWVHHTSEKHDHETQHAHDHEP